MGSEAEAEPDASSTPKLLLCVKPYAHPRTQSPERSGTLTPPLYTSASVPFGWEEEPGKPRECITPFNPIDFTQKCLEPPPRLFMDANVAKLPSPATVLKGDYMEKPRLQSSSFRIIKRERHGSFRRSCSPERGQLGAMVLSKRSGIKESVFFGGSWGLERKAFKGKRDASGGSYIYPSLLDREADDGSVEEVEESTSKRIDVTKIRRTGSFTAVSHARSPFWATIYESLKQVVPWRSRKLKKDRFI